MKKKILVIDNDENDRQLFIAALDEMKSRVECKYIECWRNARKMLDEELVDAIFVHLDPDIADNLEFVRNIKKEKKFRQTPIAVFSENMPYYNFLSRGHGADHCLLKPEDSEMIRRAVSIMLAI